MRSKFRYDFRKVLGTQNRPTCGSTFAHYVLRLNLIKDTFNIAFYTHTHTHTQAHTSLHLSIQHGISSQTLAYIYHGNHIIQGSKQIKAEM